MRILLFLFIIGIVLSNASYTAMTCCIDMDKPQTEQMAKEPCHENSHNDTHQNINADSSCDCQSCAQFGHATNQALTFKHPFTTNPFNDYTNRISFSLNTIYHPPKTFS